MRARSSPAPGPASSDGFTLFAPLSDFTNYLVDRGPGRALMTTTHPGISAYPCERQLLRAGKVPNSRGAIGGNGEASKSSLAGHAAMTYSTHETSASTTKSGGFRREHPAISWEPDAAEAIDAGRDLVLPTACVSRQINEAADRPDSARSSGMALRDHLIQDSIRTSHYGKVGQAT